MDDTMDDIVMEGVDCTDPGTLPSDQELVEANTPPPSDPTDTSDSGQEVSEAPPTPPPDPKPKPASRGKKASKDIDAAGKRVPPGKGQPKGGGRKAQSESVEASKQDIKTSKAGKNRKRKADTLANGDISVEVNKAGSMSPRRGGGKKKVTNGEGEKPKVKRAKKNAEIDTTNDEIECENSKDDNNTSNVVKNKKTVSKAKAKTGKKSKKVEEDHKNGMENGEVASDVDNPVASPATPKAKRKYTRKGKGKSAEEGEKDTKSASNCTSKGDQTEASSEQASGGDAKPTVCEDNASDSEQGKDTASSSGKSPAHCKNSATDHSVDKSPRTVQGNNTPSSLSSTTEPDHSVKPGAPSISNLEDDHPDDDDEDDSDNDDDEPLSGPTPLSRLESLTSSGVGASLTEPTGLIGVPQVGRPEDLLKAQQQDDDDDESGVRPYQCSECSYKARKKGQLRKHMATHNVFQCAHCEFTSEGRERLQEHMKDNHPSRCGRKLCKKCHVLFLADDLDEHEKECTGEKKGWTCPECGKDFKFVCAMKSHVRRWHTDEGKEATKRFPCDQCDFRGAFMRDLKQHISSMHNPGREKSIKCPECDAVFYSKEDVKTHVRECHIKERPYVCDLCQKAFKTRTHLKNHLNTHNPSDAFKCDVEGCSSTFKADKYRERHRVEVHKLPPRRHRTTYPCPHEGCSEVFPQKSHLKRHSVTHTGDKNFKCDWPDCGKSFGHADNLQLHYRRHSDDKPMKCELCDNSYRQRSGLKYHMAKTHGLQLASSKAKPKAAAGDSPAGGSGSKSGTEDDVPAPAAGAGAPSGSESQGGKDVYDFNDSDDDIDIQIRQVTPVKSPRLTEDLAISSAGKDGPGDKETIPVTGAPKKAAKGKGKKGKKVKEEGATTKAAAEPPKKKKGKEKQKAKTKAEKEKEKDEASEAGKEEKEKVPEENEPEAKPEKKGKKKKTKKATDSQPASEAPKGKKRKGKKKAVKAAGDGDTEEPKAKKKKKKKSEPPVPKPPEEEVPPPPPTPPPPPPEEEEIGERLEEKEGSDAEAVADQVLESPVSQVSEETDMVTMPSVVSQESPSPAPPPSEPEQEDHASPSPPPPELPQEMQDTCPSPPPQDMLPASPMPAEVEEEEAERSPPVAEGSPSGSSRSEVTNDDRSNLNFATDMYEMPGAPRPPPMPSDEEEDDMPPEEEEEMPEATASQEVPVIVSQQQQQQPYESAMEDTMEVAPPSVAPMSSDMPQTPTDRPSMEYPMQTPGSEPYSVPPPSYGERRSSYGTEITSPMEATVKHDMSATENYGYPDSSASYPGPGSYPSQTPGVPMPGSVEAPPPDMHINSVPPPTGGSYSSNEADNSYPPPPSVSQQQQQQAPPPTEDTYSSSMPTPTTSYSDTHYPPQGPHSADSARLPPAEPIYMPSRTSESEPAATTRSAPVSAVSSFGTDTFPSTRDFFGQYFQDPNTMPLTHPPMAQDQRSLPYQQQSSLSALQRTNADFLRRASLMPGGTYPSVTESLIGMTPSALPQPPSQQHWPGMPPPPHAAHDERSRHWGQPSPIIMPHTDIDPTARPLSRNPYSNEYPHPSFESSSSSAPKRPDSTFPVAPPPPQSTASSTTERYDLTSAYMSSRTFNPAAAPGANYGRTVAGAAAAASTQKQFEDVYRHAAHISDYRAIAQPPPPTMAAADMYSRMGMGAMAGLDKYYAYPRAEAMYRTQHSLPSAPNPFMPPTSSTQMGNFSERDYARNAMYPQHGAYGAFMSDKQYLAGTQKVPQPGMPSAPTVPGAEYLQAPTGAPTDPHSIQDPYRRSVIYNMMPRYF